MRSTGIAIGTGWATVLVWGGTLLSAALLPNPARAANVAQVPSPADAMIGALQSEPLLQDGDRSTFEPAVKEEQDQFELGTLPPLPDDAPADLVRQDELTTPEAHADSGHDGEPPSADQPVGQDGRSAVDQADMGPSAEAGWWGMGFDPRTIDWATLPALAAERFQATRVWFARWQTETPLGIRLCWGGLAACGLFAFLIIVERTWATRSRRVLGGDFIKTFQTTLLAEPPLNRDRALELCRTRPSAAAQVALAALQRWGRPTADVERGVAIAIRQERDRLKRNLGTLRRITVLAPLIGLLGGLLIANEVLHATPEDGVVAFRELTRSLTPLVVGVIMAIVILVILDSKVTKVERLIGSLERLGMQVADAVATATREGTTGEPIPVKISKIVPPRNARGLRIEIPEDLVKQAGQARSASHRNGSS